MGKYSRGLQSIPNLNEAFPAVPERPLILACRTHGPGMRRRASRSSTFELSGLCTAGCDALRGSPQQTRSDVTSVCIQQIITSICARFRALYTSPARTFDD